MSVGSYSYLEYLAEVIDSARSANITNVMTVRNPLNRGARRVLADIDLRSAKRRATITSKLFNDVYSYPSPSDIKMGGVIDIIPQGLSRNLSNLPELVTERDFDRKKNFGGRLVALSTDDLTHRLLHNGNVDSDHLVIANFDSTTDDGGTWVAYSDATNVVQDTDNAIVGNSIKFDLTGSATTAGISNTDVNDFDITNYKDNGSVLVWVYINSTTNLTDFILDLGLDLTTNYLTQTITTDAHGNAFSNGWNLLRFDFASMTENGTVTADECDSIRLYMTKTSGKKDDGYRVDYMVLHSGEYDDILYYSRYPWQNTIGTFLEDSTADTDLLNAETDEVDIFVAKGKVELFRELRRWDLVKDAQMDYFDMVRRYKIQNPSERLRMNMYQYRMSGTRFN